MDSKTIEQMIRAGLPGAEVTVQGDDGVHFEAGDHEKLGHAVADAVPGLFDA